MNEAYLKIDRQIEEVVFVLEVFIDLLEKHLLSIFVRDILDHDGSPSVFEVENLIQIELEIRFDI